MQRGRGRSATLPHRETTPPGRLTKIELGEYMRTAVRTTAEAEQWSW